MQILQKAVVTITAKTTEFRTSAYNYNTSNNRILVMHLESKAWGKQSSTINKTAGVSSKRST